MVSSSSSDEVIEVLYTDDASSSLNIYDIVASELAYNCQGPGIKSYNDIKLFKIFYLIEKMYGSNSSYFIITIIIDAVYE